MKLEDGYSVVHKIYEPENMANIYARAHGGAIYALIDEAFETAGQTDGTIAVAYYGFTLDAPALWDEASKYILIGLERKAC